MGIRIGIGSIKIGSSGSSYWKTLKNILSELGEFFLTEDGNNIIQE